MDFPTTLTAICSLSAKWPQATAKLVEDSANGSAVIDMLRGQLSGLIAVRPEGGKVCRMHAVSPLFEAKNVYFPDPSLAHWVRDVVAELTSFPNAPHDDDCDAAAQALRRLQQPRESAGCLFKMGIVDRGAGNLNAELWDKVVSGLPLSEEEFNRL